MRYCIKKTFILFFLCFQGCDSLEDVSSKLVEENQFSDLTQIDRILENHHFGLQGVDRQLWRENEPLSLVEFYRKYQDLFEGLEIHFAFEGNTLLVPSSTGPVRYHPYHWESNLERELTLVTNNHLKARTLSRAYERHIRPLLESNVSHDSQDKQSSKRFEWFLARYHFYFGSELAPIHSKLSLYPEFSMFFNEKPYLKAFEKFNSEIKEAFPKGRAVGDRVKVAVITGPYGAGHFSTASVLSSSLSSIPGYDVVVLNECTDFPDTLYIITGKYHACRIYNDIMVSEDNVKKATLLSLLNVKLSNYRPLDKFSQLYLRLLEERPNLIISTVHHIEEVTENAYLLDVPLRIVVTDYEFPEKQWFHLNHQNPHLVKYWIPTTQRSFFRPMVRKYVGSHWESNLKSTRTKLIQNQIFETEENSDNLLSSLEVFDYLPLPVSLVISPPENLVDIHRNRQLLSLSNNLERKIVTIMQGGAAVGSSVIKKLTRQLGRIASDLAYPVEFVVLSAGNRLNADQAAEGFSSKGIPVVRDCTPVSDERSPKVARIIQHKLSYPDEMASLYKASNVVISKSGGATTAELIYSGTPFIRGFALWPWEIENAKYLEFLGLSSSNDSTLNFLNFMQEDLTPYMRAVSDNALKVQLNAILSRPERVALSVDRFSQQKMMQLIFTTLENKREFQQVYWRRDMEFRRLKEELESQYRLRLISSQPLDDSQERAMYLFEDENTGADWLVKWANGPAIERSILQLNDENNSLSTLMSVLPQYSIHSRLVRPNVLLKEYLYGVTLLAALKDGSMTPAMSGKLLQLFNRLIDENLYVLDLHGGNLLYSLTRGEWVIIDAGRAYSNTLNSRQMYLSELETHWSNELLNNAYDENTRNNLQKINSILINPLRM